MDMSLIHETEVVMIKQIFSATLVLLLALTAIGCGTGTSVMDSSTPTVYDEEEYVYCLRLCRNLKNRCRDPESFSVYGTVSYYVDNQGVKQVRIPFRATTDSVPTSRTRHIIPAENSWERILLIMKMPIEKPK